MKLLSRLHGLITRNQKISPSVDEVEIIIWGLKAKLIRKMTVPAPYEVSVYVPRLEITNKVTEGNKSTETSVVLNSLTIVSAPRPPSGVAGTPAPQQPEHYKSKG